MAAPSSPTLTQLEYNLRSGDLYAYYKNAGIDVFVKRKNGMPDMRDAMNRYCYNKMKQQEKQKKSTQEASDSSSSGEEKDKTCPICYDDIQNGKVELGCKHTFCVECFTKFYLKDNKCPMCRYEFIDKKFRQMDDEHVSSLVGSALNMRFNWNHGGEPMKYSEMILYHLKYMNLLNHEDTKKCIRDETQRLMSMVSFNIRDFYEKQMFM